MKKKKEEKVKTKKIIDRRKKYKNEKKKKKIGYWLLIGATGCAILLFFLIIAFGIYIVFSAPTFNPDMLYEKESSTIFDARGNLIATLGTTTGNGTAEKRKKISYDELPEVLIDAIIATEDSRFFQHNGFDFARFTKASFGQAIGHSDSGGASTITMQVVKNTFTSNVASGIRGIIRKFTDIYMAIFKVEKNYTKEEIFEFYVNAPFLGSGSYGVEQASQVYFGKHASELSLPEAALIAGLFQAPTAYDPYLNPKDAEARRNIVLNLMVRHGYISKETAETAKKVSIKSMLASDSAYSNSPYQGFIDTVVQEVIDTTGQNPYDVPMEIHSTMIPEKQDIINKFYDGELGYKFDDKHKKIQFAAALIDNQTGAIIAIGAGRNRSGEMSYNYATMIKRHPGSTAKPLFDYGPGIEYEKWSTYTPFFDEPTSYSGGGNLNNFDFKYGGMCTLEYCLSQSRNTTALQAFKRNDNANIKKFVTSLGIEPEIDVNGYLHEAHAIGSFSGVSPVTLAGAYAAFGNGGYYTHPYSVTKIIYKDTGEIYEPKTTKNKVMSPATAYLITNVLFKVTPTTVNVSGTKVATKTGTSSYETKALKEYGLQNKGVIQDSWVATYSPDYALAFWMGYDELMKDEWFTMNWSSSERRIIQGKLVNALFEKNSSFKRPGNVVSRSVELGTIPAMQPSEYTPSDLVGTFLFISGTEPAEVSQRFSKLKAPSNLSVTENGDTATLTWNSPGTPQAIDQKYLAEYFKSGYDKYADKYLNQRIEYNNNTLGRYGFRIYLRKEGQDDQYVGFTADTTYTLQITGYDAVVVRSSYEYFTANMSDPINKNVLGGTQIPSSQTTSNIKIELLQVNGSVHPTIPIGSSLPALDSSTIKVTYNNEDLSSSNSNATINYTIKNKTTNTTLDEISDISTSTEANYEITYTVTYNGQSTSATRKIVIK